MPLSYNHQKEGINTMCTVMEELRNEILIESIKNLKITQHWSTEQSLTADFFLRATPARDFSDTISH